ncbi:M23 family metallopeptidase [Fervidibacillus albus]|uniref:M23 family metallopeptidase n=1 Tax=Fervidibacillus albus TaxID=2980026 RepID=A0A9E8LVM4_9BACI|nr:M23 family metallopeptidase [Fervidibacillus albus]WAA10527.1 M23 family metallopeptidase [Fervidibacillus albus]
MKKGKGLQLIGISFFIFFGLLPNISFAEMIDSEAKSKWIWPTDGFITDLYGTRGGSHKGIDIAEEMGTEVVAVLDGTITRSYYSNSYGNVIFIRHDVGYETVYAHLSKRLVNIGDRVEQGTTIGLMGNTGHSSGPHLHFEIHRPNWTYSKENAIDPLLIFGKVEVGQYRFCGENGQRIVVERKK